MLAVIERPAPNALVRVPPSMRAVVSWNTDAPAGELALAAHRSDGSVSPWLPYVRWSPAARRSESGADGVTRLAIDVVRSEVAFGAIAIACSTALDAIAVTTPEHPRRPAAPVMTTAELDVPRISQYSPAQPDRRDWCSAAALGMLLRYHGVSAGLAEIALGVYDGAYRGTGNWAFNAAYAGARGLRGVIAYLDGIDHVAAFVAAALPVAISIAWRGDALPGAPLDHSDGHLLVVRGVGAAHVAVNDPAHPAVATRYPRAALDRVFRAHGGVAYLIAPRERTAQLVTLANGAA